MINAVATNIAVEISSSRIKCASHRLKRGDNVVIVTARAALRRFKPSESR